jgi:hypothetical protein
MLALLISWACQTYLNTFFCKKFAELAFAYRSSKCSNQRKDLNLGLFYKDKINKTVWITSTVWIATVQTYFRGVTTLQNNFTCFEFKLFTSKQAFPI